MRTYTQTDMDYQLDYLFVKSSDTKSVEAVYQILFRCGIHMAKRFLFHWIPPYSRRSIRNDCDSKYVVLVKDRVLDRYTSTFMMKVLEDNCLYIGKIATDPKYEGQGIGRVNMAFIEKFAKEQCCNRIKLDVYIKSQRAIRFYIRNGFSVIGTRRSIRFRECLMQKDL